MKTKKQAINPNMVPACIPALGRFEGTRFWSLYDTKTTFALSLILTPERVNELIKEFMDNFPEVRKATEQIRKEKI